MTDSSQPDTFPAILTRPFARLAYNRWGVGANDKLWDMDIGFSRVVKSITNVPAMLSCLAISPIVAADFIIEPVLPHREFLSKKIASRIFEDQDWLNEKISTVSDTFFNSVRAQLPKKVQPAIIEQPTV